MAVEWRNSTGSYNVSSSTTIVTTFDAAVLSGSLLWCTLTFDNAPTITVSSVSDSVNGAWTFADGAAATNEFTTRSEIWYLENSDAGTPTVTVTLSASTGFRGLAVTEVTGVLTSGALDKTDAATGNSTSPNSTSQTTTTDGQYIAGALCLSGGLPVTDYGGSTLRDSTTDLNHAIDKVQTSAGSIAVSATLTTGNVWIATMATFKSAVTVPRFILGTH